MEQQDYNLGRVGKKMPYAMPEGFFDKMQAHVLAEVAKEEQMKHRRKAKLLRIYVAAASIAACVCVALVMAYTMADGGGQQHVASMASVDKAYDNLSQDEQQELNATYANDVYLSME